MGSLLMLLTPTYIDLALQKGWPLFSYPAHYHDVLNHGMYLSICFMLGGIPFGLLLTKIFGGKDPRTIGSGNIGTTNILRASSKPVAAATLLLDLGKGALAVHLGSMIFSNSTFIFIYAFFVVINHIFSPFLKGKGGKGFATILGTLVSLSFPLGLYSIVIAIITIIKTRMVSLGALVSVGLSPIVAVCLNNMILAQVCTIFAVILYITHSDNISRLLKGQESKIGDKNNGAVDAS
jgi:acyl phosphate:glycerol-3-phosphate acyltransferase